MIVDLFGGFKDESKKNAWDKDTIVNTYSVTKGITAICIAMLIDRGQLDVNKKVLNITEYGCNGKENTKVIDFMSRACNFGFQHGSHLIVGKTGVPLQICLQNKNPLQNLVRCKAIMQ